AHGGMPDPDTRGTSGHRCEEHLGRTHVRVLDERMVLDRPDAIEPHLLGEHRLLEALLDGPAFGVRCAVLRLCLEDHRELHEAPPLTLLLASLDTHWTSDIAWVGTGRST